MRWPAGVDIFYKERLRVHPFFAGLNGFAFDDKDEQALFRALQSCMDVVRSLSLCCLVHYRRNMGTKKARSGASTSSPTWCGK